MKKTLFLIFGSIALILAIVGIPLPVLPTTPFLLLAAWCFARSSERLHRWLLDNRLFGQYLRDYTEHRGVPRRVKAYILILLWGAIGASAFWVVHACWLRILLLAIAAAVTVHVVRTPRFR